MNNEVQNLTIIWNILRMWMLKLDPVPFWISAPNLLRHNAFISVSLKNFIKIKGKIHIFKNCKHRFGIWQAFNKCLFHHRIHNVNYWVQSHPQQSENFQDDLKGSYSKGRNWNPNKFNRNFFRVPICSVR